MSILYLNRETGQVSTEPGPWSWPLEGYSLGATRPLVISCGLHGRFEVIDRIESAEVLERPGHTLRGFASALLASAARTCRDFRRWHSRLMAEYAATLAAAPAVDAPLVSYLALAEAMHTRVPFEESLRALASAATPEIRVPRSTVGAQPYLLPQAGRVEWLPRHQRPREAVPLSGSSWLFVHCQFHGQWDCVGGSQPLPTPISAKVLTQYAKVLLGRAVSSCEDYAMRLSTLQEHDRLALPETFGFAWYAEFTRLILQASSDIGWVVAQALNKILSLDR
jgi:hypothetical protein